MVCTAIAMGTVDKNTKDAVATVEEILTKTRARLHLALPYIVHTYI
jgi:hypothetical protein